MPYDKHYLVRALRQLDRETANGLMAVIVIRRDDPFDFASLGICPDCRLPGLPHGQLSDWRVGVDEGQGLHGYVHGDRVEFHLDAVDACRDAVGHVLRDTRAVEGALLGSFGAAIIAALAGGGAEDVLAAAGVGAVGGGIGGAHMPARATKRFEFRDLVGTAPLVLLQNNRRRYGWST